MKVAIVSQPWDTLQPPITSGSIPIWTYETARRLSDRAEVVIYARRSEDQLATEQHKGIEYRRVFVGGTRVCNATAKVIARANPKFRYLSSALYYLPYGLRVAADLRSQQCDIVHIHNFSQFVPIIRALNPTIKIALHMHCEWLSQFEPKIIAARLHQTDLVIGCSDYITHKIKARFPELADRAQTTYNGVDVEQFKPDRLTEQQIDQPPSKGAENLLFVGRISPEKGLHTLIAAFEKVSYRFPTAKLYLVGPNKPTSAEFIAELSDDPRVQNLALLDPPNYPQNLQRQLPDALKEKVFFTGPVSHLALHSYFQKADILVNPSLSEAFGMSLVEAMAAGVPTIATQVGGMPDIVVPHETGLLVAPDRPEDLAVAMTTLLADRTLRNRMGKTARQRAVAVFSWEAVAMTLLGHYQKIMDLEGDRP